MIRICSPEMFSENISSKFCCDKRHRLVEEEVDKSSKCFSFVYESER